MIENNSTWILGKTLYISNEALELLYSVKIPCYTILNSASTDKQNCKIASIKCCILKIKF